MQTKEKKKIIVCVCGKSGSGKSTLINDVCNVYPMFNVVKSYTTRKPRENDPNDINTHIFYTEEDFESDLKSNLVVAEYHSDKGYTNWITLNSFKDGVNLYAIDPIACVDFYNKYKDKFKIVVMYNYLNDVKRLERLSKRDNITELPQEDHLNWTNLKNIPFTSITNGDDRETNVVNFMEMLTAILVEDYGLDI